MRILTKIRNLSAWKKFLLTLFLGSLFFLAGFLPVFFSRNAAVFFADASYDKLCREIFRSELYGNKLTLHPAESCRLWYLRG